MLEYRSRAFTVGAVRLACEIASNREREVLGNKDTLPRAAIFLIVTKLRRSRTLKADC